MCVVYRFSEAVILNSLFWLTNIRIVCLRTMHLRSLIVFLCKVVLLCGFEWSMLLLLHRIWAIYAVGVIWCVEVPFLPYETLLQSFALLYSGMDKDGNSTVQYIWVIVMLVRMVNGYQFHDHEIKNSNYSREKNLLLSKTWKYIGIHEQKW